MDIHIVPHQYTSSTARDPAPGVVQPQPLLWSPVRALLVPPGQPVDLHEHLPAGPRLHSKDSTHCHK